MSQVTYNKESEKIEKKKVEFYNGTGAEVTLRTGYAFCYDHDYGTASDAEVGRAWRVEQPATANLAYFAGVLAPGYDGETVADGSTKVVEIHVPNTRGQVIKVWTDQNCTINSTVLAPSDGSFALGAASDGYDVAKVTQTVNRSGTNGTVLARLFGQVWRQTSIESELTAAESELDLVSEAVVSNDSEILLLESECASNDSEILLLESEMSQAESRLLVVESEAASNDSEILLLESEESQAESATVANSGAISAAESELDLVSEATSQALSEVATKQSGATFDASYGVLLFEV